MILSLIRCEPRRWAILPIPMERNWFSEITTNGRRWNDSKGNGTDVGWFRSNWVRTHRFKISHFICTIFITTLNFVSEIPLRNQVTYRNGRKQKPFQWAIFELEIFTSRASLRSGWIVVGYLIVSSFGGKSTPICQLITWEKMNYNDMVLE